MSARIVLKIQGLEKLKRNGTRTNADLRGFTRIFLEINVNPQSSSVHTQPNLDTFLHEF